MEDEDEDAMLDLPIVAPIRADCVDCHQDTDATPGIHNPNMQVFQGITFVDQIEVDPSAHFTAEDGPTCTTCHMATVETYNGPRSSHTFNIVSPGGAIDIEGLQDSCSSCHEEGPVALQQLIDDIQNDTNQRIENARAAVTDETPDWVTRALDTIEGDGSAGIHNYSYADIYLDMVEIELGFHEE